MNLAYYVVISLVRILLCENFFFNSIMKLLSQSSILTNVTIRLKKGTKLEKVIETNSGEGN